MDKKRKYIFFIILFFGLIVGNVCLARPANFGKLWVRSHPFTLMGLKLNPHFLDLNRYKGAGLNALLSWEDPAKLAGLAAKKGFPWHAHIRPADKGVTSFIKTLVANTARYPGGYGWLIHDEPSYLQLAGMGKVMSWLRQAHPTGLIYGNAFPSYASSTQLYGNNSVPNYRWDRYLDDFIRILKPDVLMWDYYPFSSDGKTRKTYFSDLMVIRQKALANKIPYWAFLQTWADKNSRLPSESDLRMNVFSFLTAGYTGLAYFTYDKFQGGGLIDSTGKPLPLYAVAAKINLEVAHLGKKLRFLTSTDVRFLAGKQMFLKIIPRVNPTPSGLNLWSSGAGGDHLLIGASVDVSNKATFGESRNGLLGFL